MTTSFPPRVRQLLVVLTALASACSDDTPAPADASSPRDVADVTDVTDAGCRAPGECATGTCVSGRCVPFSCTDMIQNGRETDVDCGGDCVPCAVGSRCAAPGDCASGVCTSSRCAAR
ncbi:MAG: hypothetical protein U0326_27135 [Polyangiales bacterium]